MDDDVFRDFFTSVHLMETIAEQEQRLLSTLQEYINTQHEKLKLLNTKLEQFPKITSPEKDAEVLIKDPINAYYLARRLTREWPLILNLIIQNTSNRENMNDELTYLPNEVKLTSAAKALMRLQDVYKLDSRSLSQEKGNQANLTAMDCFEMGKYLFKERQYETAASWFTEAVGKNSTEEKTIIEDKIEPQLFLTQFFSGCCGGSRSGGITTMLQDLVNKLIKYVNLKSDNEEHRDSIFSKACRGLGLKDQSKLRCFYVHYKNPYLLIGPYKMEEQHLDPPILLFHDVIYDNEVEELRRVFRKVKGPCKTKNALRPYHRTCDVGWVKDLATPAAARVTRRVGHITNLAMRTAEENQVASYGLGGAYLLHFDPIETELLPKSHRGGRVATLMFYLNHVEAGGFTVFPRINVAVRPVKGAAAFWFNIDHRSRRLDDMLHGGCPVLRGSKWVMNKWIHEGGQTSNMYCPARGKFPRPRYYLSGISKK